MIFVAISLGLVGCVDPALLTVSVAQLSCVKYYRTGTEGIYKEALVRSFVSLCIFLSFCGNAMAAPIDIDNIRGKFIFIGKWEEITNSDTAKVLNSVNNTNDIYVMPANGKERHILIHSYNDVYQLHWHGNIRKLGLILVSDSIRPDGVVEFDLSKWNGEDIQRETAKNSLPNDFPTPYYVPKYHVLPNGNTEAIPGSKDYRTRVTFSPDGRKVAGISKGHVCVTDVDGAQPAKCVKDQEACEGNPPMWSPDGRQIVFVGPTADNRSGCNLMELFITNAEGQNLRQLTDVPGDKYTDMSVVKEGVKEAYFHKSHDPVWSPDGQWIAFFSTQGLAKIRPDGKDLMIIAKNAAYAAWSPDSKMIAYVAARGDTPEKFRYGIFVSWADGSDETWITKDLEMVRGNTQFIYEDLNWAE